MTDVNDINEIGKINEIDDTEDLGLYPKQDYVKAIEAYLSEKYSEDFETVGIGGIIGTYDNTTVKAFACAKEGKYAGVNFDVEIDKLDLKKCKDNYILLFTADKISELIQSTEDGMLVKTELEAPGGYLNSADKDISVDDAFIQLDTVFLTSYAFIVDDGKSLEEKAKQVYEIGKRTEKLRNFEDLGVVVFFVKELNADEISKQFYVQRYSYDYFMDSDFVTSSTGFQIRHGKLLSDEESILEEFGG